eukprot:756959-Hanusia_phi.AAC.8
MRHSLSAFPGEDERMLETARSHIVEVTSSLQEGVFVKSVHAGSEGTWGRRIGHGRSCYPPQVTLLIRGRRTPALMEGSML